jgi:site-specific DNA-methyltransferase (adenine-specific)
MWRVEHGDCLDVMRGMADNSVDAVVTDPPYGLSFMGKRWDYEVPAVEVWAECLRLLKPGGHLLAFAGTRTQHRMAVRIEDAGFEIRDMIAWVYGSGFPKSHDVSKAIDKAAGAERDKVPATGGLHKNANLNDDGWSKIGDSAAVMDSCTAATEAARQWAGWGTALKPAMEPITVARKPLGGTVAENVLTHGTGGLNVDGCRVGGEPSPSVKRRESAAPDASVGATGWETPARPACYNEQRPGEQLGRWPANLIHDGSEDVTGLLGDAARFFYCPKASKQDRDEGCEGMEEKEAGIKNDSGRGFSESDPMAKIMRRNHHPTVKPTELMRYLCRLVTPPGGIVLDPFTGSGSTGKAAVLEGFEFIGIEREAEYVELARARIAPKIDRQRTLFS